MRSHKTIRVSNTGQGPRVSSQRPGKVPAVNHLPAAGRPKRDWAAYQRELVARGEHDGAMLAAVFELDFFRAPDGRGRPAVPAAVIESVVLLMAAAALPSRRAEGLVRGLLKHVGADPDLAPDHSTICRRRREIGLPAAPRELPEQVVLAIDATGFARTYGTGWLVDKPGGKTDSRRAKYVKLHVGIDVATGQVLVAEVTAADGDGSGDVSCGPSLITFAAQVCGAAGSVLTGVVADGAYDADPCYRACESVDATLVANLKAKTGYGRHQLRDVAKAQAGRLGLAEWKRRTGYHLWSLVEAFFGAVKHALGEHLRAKTLAGARAEIIAKLIVYNRWLAVGQGVVAG